ncbi:MAG: NifB/NifX family molybdenum-iron cluster-binding protein [Anaerolineae bacterium]
MYVAVSADGEGLDAPASPVFGRCPYYVFVDTETWTARTIPNPAAGAGGGAGIQAAQRVVQEGVQAVISGNVGPNAFQVFQAAGVPVYSSPGGTVRQAVEALKRGELRTLGQATAPGHAGMGRGMGRGGRSMASDPVPTPPPASPPEAPAYAPGSAREQELADLRDIAAHLRRQLAEVMRRIEELEKGGR